MRIILFFIDGVGLAPARPTNLLSATPTPCLQELLYGHRLTLEAVGTHNEQATLLSLDATLGVPGEPQSATGQTSLFTGVNAAQAVGRHIRGFPTEALSTILENEGILKKMIQTGKKATFLNTYRPQFFVSRPKGRRAYATTTLLNMYAGLPFHTLDDMKAGRSLNADITNEVLIEQGYPVSLLDPFTAGERVATRTEHFDFLLFEYFLTDHFSHKRNQEKIQKCITTIDRFIAGIVSKQNLADTLLLVTSDHGNLEDLTTSAHTRNPVPLLLVGAGREHLPPLRTLTDLAPFILERLPH
ncbi:MAG: hypothetical protein NUK65_00445 [Firmicutes bacterium]|nr:hypothetical protein [Bacillota bacterium]